MRRSKRWRRLSQRGNERWGSMKKLTFLALTIYQCAKSSASVLLLSYQMLRKIKYFAWNHCISEWLCENSMQHFFFFQDGQCKRSQKYVCGICFDIGEPYLSRSLQHLARGYSYAFPTPHVCSPKELTHSLYKKPYPSRCLQSLHWS